VHLITTNEFANLKPGWRSIGGQDYYFRSNWEGNYACYLEWLKNNNQIKDWKHEPKTFWFEKIKRGVRSYLPDFFIIEKSGAEVYHEVKGNMDSKSKTKINRMRIYYPEVKLIVIQRKEYAAIAKKARILVPGWVHDDHRRVHHFI